MTDQRLSDIVSGNDALQGEEATRAGPLSGEEALSGVDSPASGSADETPASKGEEPAKAGEAAAASPAGATPAQKKPADDDAADPHPVPRKALIEERKKRQTLERQLAELNGRLSVYEKSQQAQQQPAQPAAKPKDPDDEFFELGPSGYIRKHLTETQKALREELQGAVGRQRIEISQELMRSVHADYDDVVSEFVDLARDNPVLRQQFNAQQNPAKFAYDYARLHSQVKGINSIEELTEKIRAEERAKFEAESRKTTAQADAARVSTSSASARSAGTAPVSVGHIPLSEILGR